MSGLISAGILPGAPADPLAKELATFFGDAATAAAWFERLIDYAGDATTAEQLLTTLEALPPSTAMQILTLAPVSVTASFGPEISPPLYDHPVAVADVIASTAPSIATSF